MNSHSYGDGTTTGERLGSTHSVADTDQHDNDTKYGRIADHEHPHDDELLPWRQFVRKTQQVLNEMPTSWAELHRVRWMNKRASPKTAYVPTDVSQTGRLKRGELALTHLSPITTARAPGQRNDARPLGAARHLRGPAFDVAQCVQHPATGRSRVRLVAGAAVHRVDRLPLCVLLQSQSATEGHSASLRSGYDLHFYSRLVFSVAIAQHTD